MGLLQRLFGSSSRPDFETLVQQGGKMIDVRSRQEFDAGHAKGCINIPLDQIANKASQFKKDDVILLCCRSGMRSGSATATLKKMGYTNVYNAGPWTNLKNLKK